MIRIILLVVAGLPALDMSAAASTPAWRVAPREAWVQDAPSAAQAAPAPPAGLQLHDRQIRVTDIGDDRYEHTILRVAGGSGEQVAQVYVRVDPRFQELVIHSLRLSHTGNLARVFTASQIRAQVTSRSAEGDVRKREFNPLLQIGIQVPGVQGGDILECEYTVHSRAALFPGLFVGHYAAQWAAGSDQPVHWERLHVIWPPARPLRFWISGGLSGDAPMVETHTGELDVQWRDLVPAVAETDTPPWFQRQSTVQLSDFADWPAVATTLAPQYQGVDASDQRPVPIPRVDATPDMILNALRLVQSKVHAISVAGDAAYAPAEPAVVLQRGYGDSRDLARVLAALLRGLGIDAQVALADSRRGALLDSALPSPFLLDTALVLVRAGANEYWLNPSAAGPAAALDTTDLADLRHALIIAARGGKIVTLPQPAPDSRLRSVTQQFDLRGGNLRPATLTVTTQFQGSWAQAARADLLTQTPAQLQLAQIQGVAPDYPAASADGEVQLQAPAGSPTVQIVARFRIPRPFGDADRSFNFFAEAFAEAVMPRDESTRRVPLGLPWPLKLEEHIVADLPRHYTAPIGRTVIAASAFRFQRDVRFIQGALHIDHSYVALADHVDPADYPAFLQANAQVYQALGLRVVPEAFSWRSALQWLGSHWLGIFVTAAVVAAAAAAGWRRWRVSD